jgi:ribosomal protein L20
VENRNLTYEIQICSDSLFSDNVISEKSHSNSIAIRNLNYETEYYWKVAAYDGKLSSESEMFSFTTKPDFPNWWGVQDNDEFLYLYGTAGGESQTETVKSAKENVEYNKRNFIFQMMYPLTDKFMKEAVVTDEIAKKMLKEVMKLTSDFQYEKVKTVKLETMKVTETKYRSYVQMKLSKRDVKKVFIKKMISAFKLHKELMYSASYQRFLREFE